LWKHLVAVVFVEKEANWNSRWRVMVCTSSLDDIVVGVSASKELAIVWVS